MSRYRVGMGSYLHFNVQDTHTGKIVAGPFCNDLAAAMREQSRREWRWNRACYLRRIRQERKVN
jgi:hypothetical protein